MDQAVPKRDIIDEIAGACLMSCSRRLSRVLTAIYEEELRPLALKSTQLTLLIVIAKAGPVRRIDIGRLADIDPSTLTRNISVLLQNGWVEEVRGGSEDGRGDPVRLTSKGRALIEKAAPRWRKAQQRAHKLLGEERASVLATLFSSPAQKAKP